MSAPTSAAVVYTVGDLHVEVHGQGRPVLLIHGNSGDLHYFDRIVPILAQVRRTIAMDSRGQGLSARGEGPLTIARMADDAADVIRSLGNGTDAAPDPFDIVGFSDGANVAMLLALRHPELVRSLVLNSGNIDVRGVRPGFLWSVGFVDFVLRMRARVLPRSRLSHALGRKHEQLQLMLVPPGIARSDLARIAVPTLVLTGSRDVVLKSHTRMIAGTIPDAQRRVVRGATHLLLREKPAAAAAMILEFLDTGVAPEV
ncbi:alpha/beta fold hydrolase [Planctomonas sp. JC2975]|uniref:alpha/beta fold hydrolase n=1 Tax=Planctomonas sp. JC2975 TaxID=2729626 RepID=UPI0014757B26|nr:alpha/beta hydrolase [Planctomonas sp. JC2975]NNC12512.1 alpha/beta fold hydrolase [Planctomonas sp. JC2975]